MSQRLSRLALLSAVVFNEVELCFLLDASILNSTSPYNFKSPWLVYHSICANVGKLDKQHKATKSLEYSITRSPIKVLCNHINKLQFFQITIKYNVCTLKK